MSFHLFHIRYKEFILLSLISLVCVLGRAGRENGTAKKHRYFAYLCIEYDPWRSVDMVLFLLTRMNPGFQTAKRPTILRRLNNKDSSFTMGGDKEEAHIRLALLKHF